MAGPRRRFSSTSVDEAGGRGRKMTYIPERSALRQVGKNVDPDDWPCYVLEDTTIYAKERKTIGNLLHAELQGPFVVRGRLVVDGDLRNRLVSKKMNDQYVEISDCQGFSIGSGPITLWAMGESGWLEIQPSEAYQKMYNTMAEAISIYYFITELYEEAKRTAKKGSKANPSIDQILLKYAINEGTGLVRSEAAEKIKSHAEFMLSQMRKSGSVAWKSTLFFKWLAAECHDIDSRLLRKLGEAVVPQAHIPLAVLPPPRPQTSQPPPQPKPQSKFLPHHSRPSRSTPSATPLSAPTIVLSDGPSNSTSGTAPTTSNVLESGAPFPIILHLMRAVDADKSSPKERLTLSKLGTLFYYKYSLKSVALSQEIIKIHAKAIFSSLGPEWKVAPIYTQLSEAASRPTGRKDELRIQAVSTTEVTKRRAAATFRKLPASGGYGRQAVRRHEDAPTPEPTASKTLLPPYSGRRSGKIAGLRLASSPAVKHDSSSDEDSSRPRKRRRPSPPEMGEDDSDVGTSPSMANGDAEPSSEEDAPPNAPPHVSLTILSTPLPTLSPTGPNGTWTCDRPSCSFLVRDTESEEGKEKIREHYDDHAERLKREALVRQEAAGRRLPVDHLLEKLRKLGEEARLAEDREVIGGREVVMPIKRERSMAV